MDKAQLLQKLKSEKDLPPKDQLVAWVQCLPGSVASKRPKKPKVGDVYYVPDITNTNNCNAFRYSGDKYDTFYLNNNIMCKTKEEAIDLSKKLLDHLKKIKNT